MDQAVWIIWLIVGVALIIAEIFTLGFFLLWFGVGAIAASLFGFLGFGFGVQFLVFIVVSVGMTALSRTIFANYFSHGETDRTKTGVESMPGKIGTVTIASKGALSEGAVKVFGSTWTAFPLEGEAELVEGEKVEVVEVKGSSIYVRKTDGSAKLPDWRSED